VPDGTHRTRRGRLRRPVKHPRPPADTPEVGLAATTRPRDTVMAARLSVGFTATAALVQFGYALVTPVSGGLIGDLLSYGVPALLLAISVGLWALARRVPASSWAVVPLLGVVAIVVLDVTSHDASVAAQVFLFFPVLYASSQLPRVAAGVLTALALLAEVAVTYSCESTARATFDSIYVCAGLTATSALLQHSSAANERLIERLARLATIDPLTGLVTRRALDDVAARTLRAVPDRRRPRGGRGTALLVVDLDLFKTVNDTYGHPVGDDFLVHVGGSLRRQCRPDDVVSRLGGDEFAVLLLDCPYQAALERARQLVERAAGDPFQAPDGRWLPVRFSVGVGHVPDGGGEQLRDLYARADQALYRAKALGRGRAG